MSSPPQFPNVVNCNTQQKPNGVTRTCGTGKKCYPNSTAAESFASELQRNYPDEVRQSAYACEECPYWHLSKLDAGTHSMSRSTLPTNGSYAPGLGPRYQHLQSKIKEIYIAKQKARGGTYKGIITEVCCELGVPVKDNPLVNRFLVEVGIHKKNPRLSAPLRENAQERRTVPLTLESIAAAKRELEADEQRHRAELQAKRADLERREQAWIEAHALKNRPQPRQQRSDPEKRGSTLVLSYDDAFDMVDKLTEFLAAIPSKAEGVAA